MAMKRRYAEILFWVAVTAGTLWAYSRVHTYATGQDPRTYLVLAKGLAFGGASGNAGLVVPGWPMVLAAVMRLAGIHAAFWTNVPLFVLLIGAVGTLAGRLSGSAAKGMAIAAGTALLALGGYEHNPHFLLWAFRQTPMYLTAVLALLCTERAVARRAAGRLGSAAAWLSGAAAWTVAGVLVRETGVLVLPAIGLFILGDALGWVGPAEGRGRGRWFLVALAGGGCLAAVLAALALGLHSASTQSRYLLALLPHLFERPWVMREMLGMIPDELGIAGTLALAAGIGMSLRRRHRGFLLLFAATGLAYLLFDGLLKSHRRFFLSTLFFLAPVAMLGACGAVEAAWRAVRRGLLRTGAGALRTERVRMAGWVAVWTAVAAWCAVVVSRIGPWGVRASRGDVARALATMAPWAGGEDRPLLVDGRARFLEDVLAVFADWSVRAVDADNAAASITEPPLAFVRPVNSAALHWAVPGPPAARILEGHGRLEPVPGGEFALGAGRYRVERLVRWDKTTVSCTLPEPPESEMVPPPPYLLLRLEAPECAADVPIRVSLGGRLLAERLEPGIRFLAVPAEWLREKGHGRLELRCEAETPIPGDFHPVWLHPDAPLEMEFGMGVVPSCASYLSGEFHAFDGLRGPVREYPHWEVPLLSREFGNDGEIRLPDGVGEAGAEYVARLTLAAVHRESDGQLAVTLSLPGFPDVPPVTDSAPHLQRLHECRFELGRLPRPPHALRIHVEHDVEYPASILDNPRHANVQIGALILSARRMVDSLSVRVGAPEDGALLGEGFHPREHPRDSGHGRWTDGRAELFLPLRPGRDYRLDLALSELRPEGAPPAGTRLLLNGHPVETETTPEGLSARLPAEWLAEESNRLAIESDVWSPADFGAGDDRRLGVFLRSVRAEPI